MKRKRLLVASTLPSASRRSLQRTITAAMLALVTHAGQAQHKLIRVNSESVAGNRQTMFDKEKTRLLMPQGAAFGVECVPSFSPEWMLTYDSVTQALVYKIAEKSIWHATYRSMNKLKKISKGHSKWVPRKRPKNYEAPDVKTYSLSVTPEQTQKLRAIWRTAVGAAEDRKVFLLDGTKWEYFIDGRRAKSHSKKNVLVKFTNELAEAVETDNMSRKDSLFEATQKVITDLTTPPSPEVLEPGTVRQLIIVNGTPLADSENHINVPNTIGELVCFNKLQQTVRRTRYYYDKESKQPLEEKYGIKVKGTIAEFTTTPDTLCDAYVQDHPELMQTRRYVEGYVVDKDDKPVPNAWVYVDGQSMMGTGTATDSTGHFAFWPLRSATMLDASNHTYWVSKVPITDAPITIRFQRR